MPSKSNKKSRSKCGSDKKGSKRRKNGFIKYFMSRLKECKNSPVTEVAKMAGKEWCKLPPQERQAWTNK